MPEFELDPESVSRAEELSTQLMQNLRFVSEERPAFESRREMFSEQKYAQQAEGVPINDVVAHVGQMALEFAIMRRWDGEIPCLMLDDEELAPISIGNYLAGLSWPFYGSEAWIIFSDILESFPVRYWQRMLRDLQSEDERIIATNFDNAAEAAQRGLNGFLSYRFAGMKKWADWIHGLGISFGGGSKPPTDTSGSGSSPPRPPAVGAGGGLQVQVSCSTPGLRIHIAPAYFINWVFFGSPTTPVTSYVLPGRYVFAGDGPMLPNRIQDSGVFSIPPSYYPSLTDF